MHIWGWNPSAIMVAHTHFSVNTTMDMCETHAAADPDLIFFVAA